MFQIGDPQALELTLLNKCSECNGEGLVEFARHQGFDRDIGYIDTKTCTYCDGTGFDNDSDSLHTCNYEVVSTANHRQSMES